MTPCDAGQGGSLGGAIGRIWDLGVTAANEAAPAIHTVSGAVAAGAGVCAVTFSWTGVGLAVCGAIAVGAGAVNGATGLILRIENRESTQWAIVDIVGGAAGGFAVLAEGAAATTAGFARAAQSIADLARGDFEGASWSGKIAASLASAWFSVKAKAWDAISSFYTGFERLADAIATGTTFAGLLGGDATHKVLGGSGC